MQGLECRRNLPALTSVLLGAFGENCVFADTWRPLFRYFKQQVKNVSVFRKVGRGGIFQTFVHPSINRHTFREVRVHPGAKLAIASIGLFFSIWLAMIAVHKCILIFDAEEKIAFSIPMECIEANPTNPDWLHPVSMPSIFT